MAVGDVDMEIVEAMNAARRRFEEEIGALRAQREALALAEAAAREAEQQAEGKRLEYVGIIDSMLAIKDMEITGNEVRIDFKVPHFAAGALAWSFADSLGDARNYVETYFRHPDGEHVIAVTIQRKEGKRPAELVSEMREVMQAMLDHDSSRCPWCGCWFNGRDEHDADCLTHKARELAFVPSNVPGTDRPAID